MQNRAGKERQRAAAAWELGNTMALAVGEMSNLRCSIHAATLFISALPQWTGHNFHLLAPSKLGVSHLTKNEVHRMHPDSTMKLEPIGSTLT